MMLHCRMCVFQQLLLLPKLRTFNDGDDKEGNHKEQGNTPGAMNRSLGIIVKDCKDTRQEGISGIDCLVAAVSSDPVFYRAHFFFSLLIAVLTMLIVAVRKACTTMVVFLCGCKTMSAAWFWCLLLQFRVPSAPSSEL